MSLSEETNSLEETNSEPTEAAGKKRFVAVGTPEMSYPGKRAKLDQDGKIVNMELGTISDGTIGFYTDQPKDVVIGHMFRHMASPALLYAQQEIMLLMAPESRNKIVVLLGEAGNGKTELAKAIAWASDSRGPVIFDCGGRYMNDLIWEKVIDYGEGFKQALTDRISNGGTFSAKSLEIFAKDLPDDVLVTKNGKITDIDWDKIGKPKNKNEGTDQKPEYESTAEACERDLKTIRTIATLENIPPEAINSLGIKKQRGLGIRAPLEGRILILDEITKAKLEGNDALQRWIQFMNGEINEVTLQNDMKIAGHPETDDVTLRREDMPVGYGVIGTGNLASDGFSTHGFSVSQSSRLIQFESGKPDLDDWKHQITREMTGMPFSTVQLVLPGWAKSDPVGFGDTLVKIVQMGLTDEDQAITPEQLTHLKNWDKTLPAVDMMAKLYIFFQQLVDPGSELNSTTLPDDHVNKKIQDDLKAALVLDPRSRTTAAFRDQCAIDPRKIIQDMASGLTKKPTVQPIDENSSLRLNPSAIAQENVMPPVANPQEVSAELGTRMVQAILARIGSMMADRPALNRALVAKVEQLGIIASDEYKGPTLADLLNQPLIPGLGGARDVNSFRTLLADHLRKVNSGLALKSDGEIMTEKEAGAAYDKLDQLLAEGAGTDPHKGRIIMLGNNFDANDLSTIFNQASAVDSIGNTDQPAPAALIPAAAYIETLTVPGLAALNIQALFRNTISTTEGLMTPSAVTTPVVDIAENKGALGITTIKMLGADGNPVNVNVLADNGRRKYLVVADTAVDDPTKEALRNNGITVVPYGRGAEAGVAKFVSEMLEQDSHKFTLADDEQRLIAALMLRAGGPEDEAKPTSLKNAMTRKDLAVPKPVYMIKQP